MEPFALLMNDFKAEPEELRQSEIAAMERVLRSGWYVLGREVETFERNWATVCGTSHVVGVANGMDAIEVGLRALGIGDGDEVITTPMTAFATVLGVLRAGAVPVLADVDPSTGLLDPRSVERCISPRTKAVLLVHLYGRMGDMDAWVDLCTSRGILLLEDCAQAHLARWNGRVAGSFGSFGAYSFYPTKNLGAIGDAGALVTGDERIAEQANVLRNYGQSVRYHHRVLGLNSRMDELQAALLCVRLEWLELFTQRRQQVAARLHEGLSACARIRPLARPKAPENHVYHLFVVACDQRDQLAEHLRENQVQSFAHYPVPAHHQPPGRGLRMDPMGLPAAEQLAKRCLSIPCHPQLDDAAVDRLIEVLDGFR